MSEDEAPTAWEKARRPGIELSKKLTVRPDVEDGEAVLVVDCIEIMRSKNDVQFWVLHPGEVDGTWSHWPSGELNHPLSETLQSIAGCYTDRFNPDDAPVEADPDFRFETYTDAAGDLRWRLVHRSNGETMADGGQGYSRREDMLHALSAIRPDLEVVEVDG